MFLLYSYLSLPCLLSIYVDLHYTGPVTLRCCYSALDLQSGGSPSEHSCYSLVFSSVTGQMPEIAFEIGHESALPDPYETFMTIFPSH
jgi:hypothetical protein